MRKRVLRNEHTHTMHSVLDGDVLNNVVEFFRKDKHGNSTVPSAIAETAFRSVGVSWLRASRETRSTFDGKCIVYNEHGLMSSFTGGYLLGDAPTCTRQLALLIVRDPSTNRVECVGAQKTNHGWIAVRTHNLKHLIQLIGGHNADFESRLDRMDSVYGGIKTRPPRDSTQYQTITSHETNSTVPLNVYDTVVGFSTKQCVYTAQLVLKSDLYTSTVEKHINGVNLMSIVFGYYDDATVAECFGLVVSLYNHYLPDELLPKILKHDPEHHLRVMARAALAHSNEKKALTALVVYQPRLERARACAASGTKQVKKMCKEMKSINRSGRFQSWMMNSEEREEEKERGDVDDQFAASDDDESESDEADTDDDYEDNSTMKTMKEATQLERINEMRRLIMVDSEDDCDLDF